MKRLTGAVCALALVGGALLPVSGRAQSVATIGTGFLGPQGVAPDGHGDVFVANTGGAITGNGNPSIVELEGGLPFSNVIVPIVSGGAVGVPYGIAVDSNGNFFVGSGAPGVPAVYEVLATGGYTTVNMLGGGFTFNNPYGVAVDGNGNVFVADNLNNAVYEILAAGGYTIVNTLGSGFSLPTGVAVDGHGNVFVADSGNNAVKEILAAGGYTTVLTLGSGFNDPNGVAVDGNDNVYVADTYNNAIKEILASGGYITVNAIAASGFKLPTSVSVDGNGNLFVADTFNSAVKEIIAEPPVLAAAVLPGSRSVQIGEPATFFATMINSGSTPLTGCQIALPANPPNGLSLTYQTTNPTTNALTGTANTPVTLAPGNGSQSFVFALQGTDAVTGPGFQPSFECLDGATVISAPTFAGVDTIDFFVSPTPVPDIIALAATLSGDGTAHMTNGSGVFAAAADNVGAAGAITATIDFNAAILPATATICQSSPTTGICLAPATSTVPIANFLTGATPTFAVFLKATGTIPFQPATSRAYLRFIDSTGTERGATSVAVTTN